MSILIIKYKALPNFIAPPRTMTEQSVGYDLYATDDYLLQEGETRAFPCGFSLDIPLQCCAYIYPRSGLAIKYHITVINAPAIIDPDYREEIQVILNNQGLTPYQVTRGDRIAQLTFGMRLQPVLVPSSDTGREDYPKSIRIGVLGST